MKNKRDNVRILGVLPADTPAQKAYALEVYKAIYTGILEAKEFERLKDYNGIVPRNEQCEVEG
jgi:hypothetical protein